MPSALELTLHLQQKPAQALPYFVHGVMHRLIERQSPDVASKIHGQSEPNALPKPLALNWQEQGDTLRCHLRLLDESLANPLSECLAAQEGQSFGFQHKGEQLGGMVGLTRQQSQPTYLELWANTDEAPAPQKIRLSFESPMAVSGGGQAWPLPIPRYIWNGLLWRWNSFSPINFEADLREWWDQNLLCLEYQGKSREVEGSRREIREQGFVGQAVYGFKNNSAAHLRRQTAALAQLAAVSGVGVNTAFSWGMVEVGLE